MKPILAFAILAITSFTLLSCCTPSSGSGASPSYTMTVTVAGVSHTFTNVIAVLTGSSLAITANSGTATTTAYPTFSTVIYAYTAPATYTLTVTVGSASPAVSGTFAPDANLSDARVAQTGTAVISSVSSTTVTGSVNFTNVDGTTSVGTFTAKRMW